MDTPGASKSPGTGAAADAAGSATTLRVSSLREALDVLLRLSRVRSANWAQPTPDGTPSTSRRSTDVPTATAQRAHSFVRVVLYNRQQRLVSSLHVADVVGWPPRAADSESPAPQGAGRATDKRSEARLERLVSRQQAALVKLVHDLAEVSLPVSSGASGTPGRSRRQVVAAAQSSKLNQLLGPLLAGNCKPFVLATMSPDAADHKASRSTLQVCASAMEVASACVRLTGVVESDLRLVALTPGVASRLLPRAKARTPAGSDGAGVTGPATAPALPSVQDANGRAAGGGAVLVELHDDEELAATASRHTAGNRSARLDDSLESPTQHVPATPPRHASATPPRHRGNMAPGDRHHGRERAQAPAREQRSDATNGTAREAALAPHKSRQPATATMTAAAPAPDPRQAAPTVRHQAASDSRRSSASATAPIVSEQARAAHAAYAQARAAGAGAGAGAGGQYSRTGAGDTGGAGSTVRHPSPHRDTAHRGPSQGKTPPRRSQGTPSSYTERHVRGKGNRGTPSGLDSSERHTVPVSPPCASDRGSEPHASRSVDQHRCAAGSEAVVVADAEGGGMMTTAAARDDLPHAAGPDAEAVRTRSLLFLQQWDAGLRKSLRPPGTLAPAAPHNSLHHPPSWTKLQTSGAWWWAMCVAHECIAGRCHVIANHVGVSHVVGCHSRGHRR